MANSFPALCKTTTTTSGTTDYILSVTNNVGPFRTPKQAVAQGSLSDQDVVHYFVQDTTVTGDALFEEGEGRYIDATNTIIRGPLDVIDGSSGPGVLINWGAAGQRDVSLQNFHPHQDPVNFTGKVGIKQGVGVTADFHLNGDMLVLDGATIEGQLSVFQAVTVGGRLFLTVTITAADPTLVEYPSNGMVGVHRNTVSANRFFVWNSEGTIFKIQMT